MTNKSLGRSQITINWEEVWIHSFTVRCVHCKHEQDKNEAAERGKWIPYGDELDSDYIGFHINQLYIPEFPKEKILKAKDRTAAGPIAPAAGLCLMWIKY